MNHRQHYLIVQNSQPKLGKPARMLIYFSIFMLAVLYFSLFAYYATEPDPFLNSERSVTVGAL